MLQEKKTVPSKLKITMTPSPGRIWVVVSIDNQKRSTNLVLPWSDVSWKSKEKAFAGKHADDANNHLITIHNNLVDLYKKLWCKGDVSSDLLIESYESAYPEFLIKSGDQTGLSPKYLDAVDKKLLAINQLQQGKPTPKRKLLGKEIIVRFQLRHGRSNPVGELPLYCCTSINGVQGTRFSTRVTVQKDKWDSKFQCIKENEEDTAKLLAIKNGLIAVYEEFRKRGTLPTPKIVISHYFDNSLEYDKRLTIADVAHLHLRELKQKGRSPRTLERYSRIYDCFESHCQIKFIEDVRVTHIKSFWTWMRHLKGYSQDYCNKSVQCLYGLFQKGIEHQAIIQNPIAGLRLDWENKVDLTCLDEEEMQKLKDMAWSDCLQQVVDSFLFMCYTGLHISDYKNLSDKNVKSSMKVKWIEYDRQKTGKDAMIPLHPVASGIIRKYGSITNLPKLSSKTMNMQLKVVGERIGTNKVLTTKVGRKTFTDMSINQRGMSFESVAGMLGHTSTKFVKVYGKVKHQRILSEWKA